MDYKEYEQLKEKIEAEYKKKMESLELIWEISQGKEGYDCFSKDHPINNLTNVIREIIAVSPGKFTSRDIYRVLRNRNMNVKIGYVTNTLFRLRRQKEVDVVQKGFGSKGGTFRCRDNNKDKQINGSMATRDEK